MDGFDANDLAAWSGGEWCGKYPQSSITGFCYDTRILKKGDLFVALKTGQRDGHDFLGDAQQKGAVGALVQERREESSLPQLLVDESLGGFRSIAQGFRSGWNFDVIAVTGSCGKTTTKNLLCHILGGSPVAQGTRGNLNNLIGVPTTILEILPGKCRYAIIEAGISEPGEMLKLASAITPDIVVYTAIGPAHLEKLGSVEGVAREKGLLSAGPRTKRVYMSESCRPYQSHLDTGGGLVVSEEKDESEIGSYQVKPDSSGMWIEFKRRNEAYFLEGIGKGLASNAALSIAVARDLGLSPAVLADRLATWKASGMRGEWRTIGDTNVYIDCYNANPLSMLDSLNNFHTLSESSRKRMYVIGSMEELGRESALWHERIGSELRLRPEDELYLIGDGSEGMLKGIRNSNPVECPVEQVSEVESLSTVLSHFTGDVFLKGSRRYRLETAVEYLSQSSCEERASC